MAVEADRTYDATVVSARMTEAKSGTPALTLRFETDDGEISHNLWLTHKTAKRVTDTLVLLGADKEKLRSQEYVDDIGSVIGGAQCEIVTEDHEYRGKHEVRVKWINKRGGGGKPVDVDDLTARAAYLFGGPEYVPAPKPAPEPPPTPPFPEDETVPF